MPRPLTPAVADLHGARLEDRTLQARASVAAVVHPLDALAPAGQHKQFINTLSIRLTISQQQAVRINQAFQAFAYNFLNRPVTLAGSPGTLSDGQLPGTGGNGGIGSMQGNGQIGGGQVRQLPIGSLPPGTNLQGGLALMEAQTELALATYELDSDRVQPSVRRAPKYTPLAQDALIPFAQQQFAGLRATLAASPPRFDAQGNLIDPTPLNATTAAYSAILNALAENSVHPELFRSPSDFYINPQAKFTLNSVSTPARAAAGYFRLGPGGVPLSPTHR